MGSAVSAVWGAKGCFPQDVTETQPKTDGVALTVTRQHGLQLSHGDD